MKKIIYSIICVLFIQLLIVACKEDDPQLGPPPAENEASFTYAPTEGNKNIINFSTPSSAFMKKWDFGDGKTAEGSEVQATYPLKGLYEVTLTVYTAAGSVSSKQTVNIEESDFSLFDPLELLLANNDAPEGKTWVIDAATTGHMGIGPVEEQTPIWWEAPPNDKSNTGLYDDKFTFNLYGFKFTQATHGDVYVNGAQAPNFPGAYPNKGDYTAPYTDKTNLKWSVTKVGDKKYLNVPGGFIGYYTGVSTYEVLSSSADLIYLRFTDAANPALAWYHRLVPDDGSTPPPPTTSTLPIDFEGEKPPFTGFGNTASTYDVVANPNSSGINTSAKVGQYVKGSPSWSGIVTTLSSKIDFSTKPVFKYKVYSPVAGRAPLKFEVDGDPNTSVEKFADVTQVNQWQEISFDFSGTASNTYSKMALFLDFDNDNGGTFYIDDIQQAALPCPDDDLESLNPNPGIYFTVASVFFGQFGNITAAKIDNPFQTGINTSCYVNSYIKNGGCETWSGVGYLVGNAIDFGTTTKKKFKLKVYAVDQATQVTLRLERLPYPDTEPSAERTANITATGQWQELTFDFSDITDPNTYKNLIIYFEKGAACDGDKYYFDDLIQTE